MPIFLSPLSSPPLCLSYPEHSHIIWSTVSAHSKLQFGNSDHREQQLHASQEATAVTAWYLHTSARGKHLWLPWRVANRSLYYILRLPFLSLRAFSCYTETLFAIAASGDQRLYEQYADNADPLNYCLPNRFSIRARNLSYTCSFQLRHLQYGPSTVFSLRMVAWDLTIFTLTIIYLKEFVFN